MKIGIITANHKREDVLEVFALGIDRLRRETGMEIIVACAGDESGAEICNRHSIIHIPFPNNPVTEKFNTACHCLKDKVDAVMVLGSDDIVSTETFIRTVEALQSGYDAIRMDTVYFLECRYGRGWVCRIGPVNTLVVGMTIRSEVLNPTWKPWVRPADRGFDIIFWEGIRENVKKIFILKDSFILDIKTNVNLNKPDYWLGKYGTTDFGFLVRQKLIGEEEIDKLSSIIRNNYTEVPPY